MSDLIERLRTYLFLKMSHPQFANIADDCAAAADELEQGRKAVKIQRERADANLEYAKKCETLLRRLWIRINGDDVFLQDAIEGTEIAGDRVPSVCEWFEDDDGWHGSCGQWWEFTHDGPKETEMKHCMKCGKPIVVETAGV